MADSDYNASADQRRETSTSVLAEFVDAARAAAESLLEEQKRQIAERVGGIAEALHRAVDSLERSQNTRVAHHVKQAAGHLGDVSRSVRERRWGEVIADTEDFARRQPTLFVLGAMATGFLVGRFLWAGTSDQRQANEAVRGLSQRETADAVAAAVSSGSNTAAGELSGDGSASSGVMEAR